ncbi:MAG: hypothetical protein GY757_20740 [bacterium]|nr:hypothetical protein [bacterium]
MAKNNPAHSHGSEVDESRMEVLMESVHEFAGGIFFLDAMPLRYYN